MNSANSQTNNSLDGTHAGYFVIADISGYTGFLTQNELVYRLLKTSVILITGMKAYALLTEAFISKARFGEGGLGSQPHVEEYPELGVVKGRVLDLTTSLDRYGRPLAAVSNPKTPTW